MSENWLVETHNKEEREKLWKHVHVFPLEIYQDGSTLVRCDNPQDEDDLSDYCDQVDLECRLS